MKANTMKKMLIAVLLMVDCGIGVPVLRAADASAKKISRPGSPNGTAYLRGLKSNSSSAARCRPACGACAY